MNSQVEIEPIVADVNPDNVERLIGDVDLVLDGTDNFETRLLVNDACVKHTIPWIYGAVISTHGMTMSIIPHQTPCFRCFLPEKPAPGSTSTCDTVGVLGPAVNVIASLEVVEGFKILMGKVDKKHPREDEFHDRLLYVDVWTGAWERLKVGKRDDACPVCDLDQYEFLEAKEGSYLTSLCGREAVQVNMRGEVQVSFPDLAKRLSSVGQVSFNDYMLRFRVDSADSADRDGRAHPYELTIFPDGRAIVKGATDEAVARTLYARYIGL